jgi:hypothetical protein
MSFCQPSVNLKFLELFYSKIKILSGDNSVQRVESQFIYGESLIFLDLSLNKLFFSFEF